jgi:hypothetical protein
MSHPDQVDVAVARTGSPGPRHGPGTAAHGQEGVTL